LIEKKSKEPSFSFSSDESHPGKDGGSKNN
jgi:hypothetical protein